MKLGDSSFAELVSALETSLTRFRVSVDSPVVTDIHIMAKRESGELVISDDDKVLQTALIADFTEIAESEFQSVITAELKRALQHIDCRQPLERLYIWKPFSFILVDDDGETLDELMLFDDENAMVSQTLMEGLDSELDEFLRSLLPD